MQMSLCNANICLFVSMCLLAAVSIPSLLSLKLPAFCQHLCHLIQLWILSSIHFHPLTSSALHLLTPPLQNSQWELRAAWRKWRKSLGVDFLSLFYWSSLLKWLLPRHPPIRNTFCSFSHLAVLPPVHWPPSLSYCFRLFPSLHDISYPCCWGHSTQRILSFLLSNTHSSACLSACQAAR